MKIKKTFIKMVKEYFPTEVLKEILQINFKKI